VERGRRRAPRARRGIDPCRRRAYGRGIARALALLGATAAILLSAAGPAYSGFGFLTAWGGLGAAPGQFSTPDGIAVDALGHVYVADRLNNRIQKFSATGRFLASFGTRGNGNGQFDTPYGVAVDGWGFVYVADTHNNRIQKLSPVGRFLAAYGTLGTGDGQFNDPRGVAIDDAGDIYVADHNNHRVQKLSPAGRFLAKWGRNGGDGTPGTGNGEFNKPRGVAIDHAGDLYVADKGNNRIQEFGPDGSFIRRWGANGGDGTPGTGNGEFELPYNIALDGAGHLFVTDVANNRVQEFTATGAFLARFGHAGGDGTAGSGRMEFDEPYGIAIDCRSNVYVTDEGNQRVQKLGLASAAPPRCPPVLTATVAGRQRGIANRRLAATIGCDRPCNATVRSEVAGVRGPAVRRTLLAGRSVRVHLVLRAAEMRRLRSGHRALVTATAVGFAGAARAVRTLVTMAG
jgi:DNA-binding beta-propeller fold protein YncE